MSDIPVSPPNAEDPVADKAQMRKDVAKIRQQEANKHPHAAEILAGYSQLLLTCYGPGVYAAYLPIRSEISPLPLIAALQ